MWWLLPVGIIIGIIGTVVGCAALAKWLQKKIDDES